MSDMNRNTTISITIKNTIGMNDDMVSMGSRLMSILFFTPESS